MSLAEAEAKELALAHPAAGLWSDAFDRLRRNPGAIVGFVLILAFVLVAIFAPVLTEGDPNKQVGRLATNGTPPDSEHVFGLDKQGRDYFTRVLYGTRLSLLVGVVSALVGLAFGLVLGSIAGYIGKWVDTLVMRLMDVLLAIPPFLLAIGLVTLLGRGLIQVMVAVGLTNVPVFARLLRGTILGQRESDYVLAARSVGVPGRRMLLRHILPNSLAPVIVQGTLAMATGIIDVAALSFVGLGPSDPGLPEWGAMLADSASRLAAGAHLVLFPGIAIVVSVLGWNLLGDGLREAIDPKLKS